MPKHYFVYRSLADLKQEAVRLGIDLPLVEDREEVKRVLARPVTIRETAESGGALVILWLFILWKAAMVKLTGGQVS